LAGLPLEEFGPGLEVIEKRGEGARGERPETDAFTPVPGGVSGGGGR
jgi:hypothetical protein